MHFKMTQWSRGFWYWETMRKERGEGEGRRVGGGEKREGKQEE